MTIEDKHKLHARYDQRGAHAFTAHSCPDTDGYQRLNGPALALGRLCSARPDAPASPIPHEPGDVL